MSSLFKYYYHFQLVIIRFQNSFSFNLVNKCNQDLPQKYRCNATKSYICKNTLRDTLELELFITSNPNHVGIFRQFFSYVPGILCSKMQFLIRSSAYIFHEFIPFKWPCSFYSITCCDTGAIYFFVIDNFYDLHVGLSLLWQYPSMELITVWILSMIKHSAFLSCIYSF